MAIDEFKNEEELKKMNNKELRSYIHDLQYELLMTKKALKFIEIKYENLKDREVLRKLYG